MLEITSELVTTAAAVTVALVSVLGLERWRRQLQGQTEYELARRLLRAVYKVRDELNYVRAPFMSAGEIAIAVEEADLDVDSISERRAIDTARSRRWQELSSAMSDMEVEALEAEVLWGDEIQERLESLRQCVRDLHTAYIEYYALRDEDGTTRERDERMRLVELRRRIFGTGGERDQYAPAVEGAIDSIENHLRSYLAL